MNPSLRSAVVDKPLRLSANGAMRRDMLRVKAPKKMAIGGNLVLMRSANVRARIPMVKYAFVAMTISPEKLRFNPHLSLGSGPAARFTR
jgi:hypothetical protein